VRPPPRALVLALAVAGALVLAGCTNPLTGPGDATGPGQRAADYLRPAPYRSILVELDFVAGADPEQGALALFEQRFEAATGKAVDVVRTGGVPGQGASHRYTLDEIAALEREHRQHFSQGDRAALYVLWLDGGFERDSGETKTLGAAYRGSSVVMFKANLRSAAKASALDLTKPALVEVEQSVFVHELGHVLGLVNLGTPMVSPHEDAQHPGHSSNQGSVMYWAVETNLIGSILGQNPPDDFDANDKADLRAMREGR
jgi:hypothetical protein